MQDKVAFQTTVKERLESDITAHFAGVVDKVEIRSMVPHDTDPLHLRLFMGDLLMDTTGLRFSHGFVRSG
jgi:hypothetical protein